MIAEIPMPILLDRKRARRRVRARAAGGAAAPARPDASVEVTGIGFFDPSTHDRPGGTPSNGLELHPVIALKFIPATEKGGAR